MSDRLLMNPRRLWRGLRRRYADFRVPTVPKRKPRKILFAEAAADDRPAIVFFAPEAGIVPHFMAHCVVAKTLQELGHRVLMIQCFDVYPQCVVMDSRSLPHNATHEERMAVCAGCLDASNEMTATYGLEVFDLRDLIDDATRDEIAQLIANLPEDLSTVQIEGLSVGKICGAQAAVTFKTTDFTGKDPAVRALLVRYLQGSLLSYRAMQKLLANVKVARVVHFNEYDMLLLANLAARRENVPVTNMTMASIRGVDRRRISFMDEPLAIESYRRRLAEWPQWRGLALTEAMISDITDDCLFRMSSNSAMVYSPSRTGSSEELAARLNLAPDRKLIVAFTSSLDEIAANSQYLSALGYEPFTEIQPFANQVEWLEALIVKVEASKDLQMVVRVHPREDANRRENVSSSHLQQLRAHFSLPFNHVRVVWPAESVSSYDLMELADVGLSAWSSTALEMARLGVPSIIAFDHHTPFPIGDVVKWAPDRAGYFACLDEALKAGPSLDQIRASFRWSYLRILATAVDLGDVIPDPGFHGLPLPPYHRPAAAKVVEDILVHNRSALDVNRDAILSSQNAESQAREDQLLKRQLRRCLRFLCTGEDRHDDYVLHYADYPMASIPASADAVLSVTGNVVEFRTRDRVVHRQSRMAQRLAFLSAQLGGSSASINH